jgi:hypothetical protein
MFGLGPATKIYVSLDAVDMRKGFDGLYADSDEENRSFRAEDDQDIAERRWQSYCAAGDRHESRKRLGI